MPGPPPKDPVTRQRRNKPKAAERVLAEAAASRGGAEADAATAKRRRIPNLGDCPARGGWHADTRAWWTAVWESPVATRYLPMHEHGLRSLAVMVDMRYKLARRLPATLREYVELTDKIRLLGREYWLHPVDMARSTFPAEPREPAKAEERQLPQEDEDDPRKLLRVVSS